MIAAALGAFVVACVFALAALQLQARIRHLVRQVARLKAKGRRATRDLHAARADAEATAHLHGITCECPECVPEHDIVELSEDEDATFAALASSLDLDLPPSAH